MTYDGHWVCIYSIGFTHFHGSFCRIHTSGVVLMEVVLHLEGIGSLYRDFFFCFFFLF
jgi:hypothetical protein